MVGLSYMQRRTSGIYEFRKRLPQELAGKPVPQNLPTTFSELVNPTTKRFKRELTISLQTTDFNSAKRKDMREALRVIDLFALAGRYLRGEVSEQLSHALSLPSLEEIETDTISALLKQDEETREDGDFRRHRHRLQACGLTSSQQIRPTARRRGRNGSIAICAIQSASKTPQSSFIPSGTPSSEWPAKLAFRRSCTTH